MPEDGDSEGLVSGKVLQIFNHDAALRLVVFGSPMVIEIIQDLHTTVKVVEDISKEARLAERFDGVHQPRGQTGENELAPGS
jgi:hypothetical protein